MMKKIITKIFVVVLLMTASIYGQDNDSKVELVDEFSRINLEELFARVDSFRSSINRKEGSTGLIKIFGGRTDRYFSYPYVRKAHLKAYLAQLINSNPNKFVFQNCDITEPELRTQLFIVPFGAEIEKCEENFYVPQQTVFFGGGYDYEPNPYEQIDGCCDVKGSENFIKKESQDLLLRLLKNAPESRVYVIGYAGKFSWEVFKENKKGEMVAETKRKTDSLKLAETIANQTKKSLIKKGIDKSKIIVINGGYNDNYRRVSIYFVPKGGEIPKPEPDYFPKKPETR